MSCAEGCCNTDFTPTTIQFAPKPINVADMSGAVTITSFTADLTTRAQLRAEGRISEREAIAKALKDLPADALFYPGNILKILKLD